MRNLILGVIVGMLIGGGSVWAYARRLILQDAGGVAYTAANPLPVAIQ